MNYVWVFLIGYLLGSFPSAVLFSKWFKRDDVRNHGSGNPGTSNMVRTFGVKLGLLVLLCDVAKGLLASLIGGWILGAPGLYYGGLLAVVGHNWPITLRFKGGKGVATSFGMVLAIMPFWGLMAAAVFVLITAIFRYASVGSLSATLFVWVVTLVQYAWNTSLFLAITLLTVMIFLRHRSNIERLIKGTESKLSL